MNDEVRRQWGNGAFPISADGFFDRGMSLLDYFAGQALAGLLAFDSTANAEADASDAYIVAEAMMQERRKRIERAKTERIPRPAPDAAPTETE